MVETANSSAAAALSREQAGRLMRLATYASVSVATVLIAFKFAAWLATDSVSLLSTLVDSLLDVLASLINLLAVRHALAPADREHRWGHGKAEPLAALAQAAFISGSAMFLLIEAADRFIFPHTVTNSEVGIAVMLFSIALTVALVGFQKFVVSRTGSPAIRADSLHYQVDLLVNLGVIVSLLMVSRLGWDLADPLIALAIAGYILWGVFGIGRVAIKQVMDEELPEDERRRIREIVLAHPDVRDLHDMRTRMSGTHTFIELHVEMDGNITLRQAHDIAEAVMYQVESAFPNAQVLIHQDPEGIEERRQELD
jgi:ferrous-iron efflux pump FieF